MALSQSCVPLKLPFFYDFYFFIGTDVCCLKMSSGWAGGLYSRALTMNAVLAKGKPRFYYCLMKLFGKFKDFHIHASYVYAELH